METPRTILAIDPGPEHSAFWLNNRLFGKVTNTALRHYCSNWTGISAIACEEIRSYGMSVGAEVFDTVRFTGRLEEIAHSRDIPFMLVGRGRIKSFWCKSQKATDSNIRQALIDFYGAPGVIKNKGPTYGIHGDDQWSALAIAGYFQHQKNGTEIL